MKRRPGLIAGVLTGIRFAVKSLEPSLMRRNAIDQGLIMGGSFLTGFLTGSLTARVLDLLPFGAGGPTVRALGVAAASSRSAQSLQRSPDHPPNTDEVDAWGEMAAETLSNSYVYTVTGYGHGPSRRGECPRSIVMDFLNDPTTEPDTSCLDELGPPDFVIE